MIKEHISFSELSDWTKCAHYHKKVWLEKEKAFLGNEHTCFGTAIHHVCETIVMDEYEARKNGETYIFDLEASYKLFLEKFEESMSEIEDFQRDEKLVSDMKKQAPKILPEILPALKATFGSDYKVKAVELQLYEPIANSFGITYNYKGFVDLILEARNKLHVLDWKTCSWGWKREKKSEKMVTYQLTYYKKFASQYFDIPERDIKVYFALLKRTANKNNVEIFEVPCGERKVKNALQLLEQAVYNITNGNHPKNKLSCEKGFYGRCPLYDTCIRKKKE